ncbi:MAG TPA: phosphatase PAP2 family protein [Aquamicrobium sp.]|nr:phosphatase PAP2 family protein [Aquamicrobium sp.]
MLLYPGERIVAGVIVLLFVADGLLILRTPATLDWGGYAFSLAVGFAGCALGLAYRHSRRSEEIALATLAAGLFVLFTIVGSLFNHLLLPVGESRLDAALASIDGWLGYSWPDLVAATAGFPAFGALLRLVYLSSLPQLVVVILVLGLSGRRAPLHRFLVTGVFGALISVGVWSAMPSFGPAVYHPVAAETVEALAMVVGPAYGAELSRLAVEGPTLLSPKDALGLIAFPSFHTVMACMAVWFTRPFPRLFPAFLVVNLLMVPAILVHGGHHLMDVFGGVAVFALALAAAGRLLRARPAPGAPVLAPHA